MRGPASAPAARDRREWGHGTRDLDQSDLAATKDHAVPFHQLQPGTADRIPNHRGAKHTGEEVADQGLRGFSGRPSCCGADVLVLMQLSVHSATGVALSTASATYR